MKVIFVVLSVILLTQNSASGKSVLDESDPWECVEEIFREIDVERLGDMALDFVSTVSRLMDHRQTCLNMTIERLREACLLAWRASVLYEVVRMRNRAQNSDAREIFEQLAEDIFQCLDHDESEPIPPPALENVIPYQNEVLFL